MSPSGTPDCPTPLSLIRIPNRFINVALILLPVLIPVLVAVQLVLHLPLQRGAGHAERQSDFTFRGRCLYGLGRRAEGELEGVLAALACLPVRLDVDNKQYLVLHRALELCGIALCDALESICLYRLHLLQPDELDSHGELRHAGIYKDDGSSPCA